MNWGNKTFTLSQLKSLVKYLVNRNVIILLFCFSTFSSYSLSENEYKQTRDSLEVILDQSTGEDKVDAIFNLIRLIGPFERNIADSLVKVEFDLAESLGYEIGIAKAYQSRGDLYYYESEYSLAFDNYLNAANIFNNYQDYKAIGENYWRFAMIFLFVGNSNSFIEYMSKAKENFIACGCWGELYLTLNEYGYYYNNLNPNIDSAKNYHREAMKYLEMSSLPSIEYYFAALYISYAFTFESSHQPDSSIYYLRKAIAPIQGCNADEAMIKSIAFNRMGVCNYQLGRYDSASYFLNQSIDMAEEYSYQYITIASRSYLARLMIGSNDWNAAMTQLKIALGTAEEIYRTGLFYSDTNIRYAGDWLLDSWPGIFKVFSKKSRKFWVLKPLVGLNEKISKIYKSQGDKSNALIYYESYHAWTDTLNLKTKALELVGMELDFESKIKDRQIENLQQESELKEFRIRQSRILLFGALGILALGIMVVILLFRQRKLRTEQEKIILQQKLFRSQINPHFVFNSLTSIQHLVVSDDADKASIYLADFSNLVRSVLYSSIEEYISFEQEIKIIQSYLELQKLRYDDKFAYTIDVDPMIDKENFTLPSMMAQPFIENAIEHGFRHKKDKGHLHIEFKLTGDFIQFEITDDGVGREKAGEFLKKRNKDHQSLSTSITRERINVLNRKSKEKIKLDIIDLKDDSGKANGTRVIFKIPLDFRQY